MTLIEFAAIHPELDMLAAWRGDASDPRYLSSGCPRSSPLQGFALHEDVEADEDAWKALRALARFGVPGRTYSTHPESIRNRKYRATHPVERQRNIERCREYRERQKQTAVAA